MNKIKAAAVGAAALASATAVQAQDIGPPASNQLLTEIASACIERNGGDGDRYLSCYSNLLTEQQQRSLKLLGATEDSTTLVLPSGVNHQNDYTEAFIMWLGGKTIRVPRDAVLLDETDDDLINSSWETRHRLHEALAAQVFGDSPPSRQARREFEIAFDAAFKSFYMPPVVTLQQLVLRVTGNR